MPAQQAAPLGVHQFRHYINGLRAWAVLVVVLFHFGVPGFAGGFVGVDVFFVISGFLMTGIVLSALQAGNFSFLRFYLARARRILPALLALCAALLGLGWCFWLPSGEYVVLGKHALASMLFFSNNTYHKEAGYFATSSHEKWLLHTWSLSVEWQFYLLLPVLLFALWKLFPRKRMVGGALAVLGGLSLAQALLPGSEDAGQYFFSLTARAWEMLAGGLVFLLEGFPLGRRSRHGLELAGIALIIAAVTSFDETLRWPSAYTLLPIIGTVLVLVAANERSLLTGSRPMQWLGNRSYSIYLWHWPVAVALFYQQKIDQPAWIATGLAGALLLGQLSYWLVEVPSRRWLGRLPIGRAGFAVLAPLFVAVACAVLVKNETLAKSEPWLAQQAEREQENRNPLSSRCFVVDGENVPGCVLGGQHVVAALVGDSHANAVATAFAAALPPDSGVLLLAHAHCPTMLGAHQVPGQNNGCEHFNLQVFERLRQLDARVPVVIVSRASLYLLGENAKDDRSAYGPQVYFSRPVSSTTPEFIEEYRQHLIGYACTVAKQHPVYLMRPLPEMGLHIPRAMARAVIAGRPFDFSLNLENHRARNAIVWQAQDQAQQQCGVKLLDPLPQLCENGRCVSTQNNRPLYYDRDHLSEFGNKRLVPLFKTVKVAE
jgi:peptidoglycan/LPS O-acetylase OafA/YrhL